MADMQELGALWWKRSERTGNEFYSGDLDIPGGGKIKIIAFDNDRKTKESQPDIRIYLSEDRDRGSGHRSGYQENRNAGSGGYQGGSRYSRNAPQQSAPAPAPVEYPTEDIDPDDIPF